MSEADESASQPLGLEAPTGNPRYPAVDGLRALAAFSVIVYHVNNLHRFPGWFGRLAGHGDYGVVLFFLISGFLLYRPYAAARAGQAPRVDTKRFYRARILRIVPGYWVALTILASWPGVADFGSRWWQFYLFGQVYTSRTVFGGGIGAAWSLCVEMSFYLLLPLYAAAVGRLLRHRRPLIEVAVLTLIAVGSIGAHLLIKHSSQPNVAFSLPGSAYLFAVGMAMAVLSVDGRLERWLRRIPHWSTIGLMLAAAWYVGLSAHFSSAALGSVNPYYAVMAALILAPAVFSGSDEWTRRLLTWRPVAWLGLVSYGIYLWHQGVLGEVGQHTSSPWLTLLATAAIAVVIATASYYLVERPFLRLKQRRCPATPAPRPDAPREDASPPRSEVSD